MLVQCVSAMFEVGWGQKVMMPLVLVRREFSRNTVKRGAVKDK